MRNYLNERVGREINDSEWKDCVDYFVEYADYIEEVREDEKEEWKVNRKKIKEGACLEVVIGEEYYEVLVGYSWIWESDDNRNWKEIVLIGFDYDYVDYFEE